MKVAKLVAPRHIELFEESIPELRCGEVLVELKAVGICGSDLHYFRHGGLGSFMADLPMRMGHEAAGIIVQSEAPEFQVGNRVAIEPARPCKRCRFCSRGLFNLCPNGTFLGTEGAPGAFQEFIVMHKSQLAKLDANMTYEIGAMFEPLGVAYHAAGQAELKAGLSVAIVGVGPIGLCLAQMARIIGADPIFVTDLLKYRVQEAGRIFGALPLVEGRAIDIVFDAAGTQDAIDTCFRAAIPGGKVILVGIPEVDYLTYNPHKARIKELSVINVRRSNETLSKCLELYREHNLSLDVLATHRYPLESIQTAFETASAYRDQALKIMIIF